MQSIVPAKPGKGEGEVQVKKGLWGFLLERFGMVKPFVAEPQPSLSIDVQIAELKTAKQILHNLSSAKRSKALLPADKRDAFPEARIVLSKENTLQDAGARGEMVLEHLIKSRLVRSFEEAGETFYELAHEYMIEKIRNFSVSEEEAQARGIMEMVAQDLIAWNNYKILIEESHLDRIARNKDNPYLDFSTASLALICLSGRFHERDIRPWREKLREKLFEYDAGEFLLLEAMLHENADIRNSALFVFGELWHISIFSWSKKDDPYIWGVISKSLIEEIDLEGIKKDLSPDIKWDDEVIEAKVKKTRHTILLAWYFRKKFIYHARTLSLLKSKWLDDDEDDLIEIMTDFLEDGDKYVREYAASYLDSLDWQPTPDRKGVAYWFAQNDAEACAKVGNVAKGYLEERLNDDDREMQLRAIKFLGKIADLAVLAPLLKMLCSEDEKLVDAASLAISGFGMEAVQALNPLTRDEKKRVRFAAITTLVKVAQLGDIEKIHHSYFITTPRNRYQSRAKAQTLQPDLDQIFLTCLENDDTESREISARALEILKWEPEVGREGTLFWFALGDFHRRVSFGVHAVSALEELLGASSWHARKDAANILSKIGWLPYPGERAIDYWVARLEPEKCVELGKDAIPALVESLKYLLDFFSSWEDDWSSRDQWPGINHELENLIDHLVRVIRDVDDKVFSKDFVRALSEDQQRYLLRSFQFYEGKNNPAFILKVDAWLFRQKVKRNAFSSARVDRLRATFSELENWPLSILVGGFLELIMLRRSTLQNAFHWRRLRSLERRKKLSVERIEADPDPAIRKWAANSWGDGPDPRYTEYLRKLLLDQDFSVQRSAAKALARKEWIPAGDSKDRLLYWFALGDISKCAQAGEEIIPIILKYLFVDTWAAQAIAIQILHRLDHSIIENLLAYDQYRNSREIEAVAKALRWVEHENTIATLIALFVGPGRYVREAARESLGHLLKENNNHDFVLMHEVPGLWDTKDTLKTFEIKNAKGNLVGSVSLSISSSADVQLALRSGEEEIIKTCYEGWFTGIPATVEYRITLMENRDIKIIALVEEGRFPQKIGTRLNIFVKYILQ